MSSTMQWPELLSSPPGKWYQSQFLKIDPQTPEYEYLLGRGLRSDWIEELDIRIFPEDLTVPNFGEFGKKLCQVLSWRPGSFVFPIYSPRGHFQGMELRDVQKNIAHYVLDSVSERHPLWYGMSLEQMTLLWETGNVWIVEGMFDLAALRQVVGKTAAVLASGTAALSSAQLLFLQRMAKKVMLAFDMDRAGRRGQREAEAALSLSGVRVVSIEWRGGKDLGVLWDLGGSAKVREHLLPYF